MKHFLTIEETPAPTLRHVLEVGQRLRTERLAGKANAPVLAGKTLAMLFEKPSLRTRVSFEQAMIELGGHAIVMGKDEVGLGKREKVTDVAQVLCGMVHGIAGRVFDHQVLVQMAEVADKPLINMLSDWAHPAQALADAMTMLDEFDPGGTSLKGRHVVFIGDANNVTRSLAMATVKLGGSFTLACPKAYQWPADYIQRLARVAGENGGEVRVTEDPAAAVRDADAIHADTFVSMGQEEEKARRLAEFAPFQLNEALLAKAPKHSIVMHCLPAYRGVEITDGVMDGPHSRVFPQAHNRLHAQKGLLAVLMGGM